MFFRRPRPSTRTVRPVCPPGLPARPRLPVRGPRVLPGLPLPGQRVRFLPRAPSSRPTRPIPSPAPSSRPARPFASRAPSSRPARPSASRAPSSWSGVRHSRFPACPLIRSARAIPYGAFSSRPAGPFPFPPLLPGRRDSSCPDTPASLGDHDVRQASEKSTGAPRPLLRAAFLSASQGPVRGHVRSRFPGSLALRLRILSRFSSGLLPSSGTGEKAQGRSRKDRTRA